MIILRVLGNSLIESGIGSLTPAQEILFATALYLILERDRKVTREALEEIIWPGSLEAASAHHRLRQTFLKLKQAGIPIRRDKGFIRIDATIRCDFDSILSLESQNTLQPLPESFQILPDYSPRFSTPFAHWLDERRSQINTTFIRLLLDHIRHARNRAEWARVEKLSRTCLEIDPYNEEAVLARAESVALRGGKLEALALLDQYLVDLGEPASDLKIPPSVMRRRISEKRIRDSYRPESEFVGRGPPMELLTTLFSRAKSGVGQALLIRGKPGIGKSRLLSEFARFAELQGAQVERARLQPSDKERPLAPFIDLVPNLLEARGALGCNADTIRRLESLNSSAGPADTTEAESELVYPRIRTALFDILDAVSEEQPLIICLDDVQWLDSVSTRLTNEVARWCSTHRLLLIVSSRHLTGTDSNSNAWPELQQLDLQALDSGTSSLLFDELVGKDSRRPTEAFKERSITIADGNPFFIQEITRHWSETGDELQLPHSLDSIIRDRISRLSDQGILTLQTCAVLGKYSTIERIEAILEYKAHELLAALDELGTSSMVTSESQLDGSNTRYACRHDLLATAAVSRLNPVALAYLHRRVGLLLESESQNGSAALLWECANHWHLAGDSVRALELAVSCGRHMTKVGLYSEAAKMFGNAASLTDSPERLFEIATERLKSHQLAGEWQAVYDVAEELSSWNPKESVETTHNAFEIVKFDAQWKITSNWHHVAEALRPCVFSSTASASHRVEAAILGMKICGNLAQTEMFDEIFSSVSHLLEDETVSRALRLEVEMIYYTDRGDLDAACIAAESYIREIRASDSIALLVGAMRNAAHVFRRCGKTDRVTEVLTDAYMIAQQNKLSRRATLIALSFVKSMLDAGDLEQAEHWHSKSDEALLVDDWHSLVEYHLHAARLALYRDRVDQASYWFGRHFSLIDTEQNTLRRVSALALLVLIQSSRGDDHASLAKPLRDLEHGHLLVRGTGGQDFETAALITGLYYIGESAKADALLGEYLAVWRRDKGPVCIELDAVLGMTGRQKGKYSLESKTA